MPSTPLPMEIVQTHDDSTSWGNPPALAAWKMITRGPAYEITVAMNPATTAESEQSLSSVFMKPRKSGLAIRDSVRTALVVGVSFQWLDNAAGHAAPH